MWAHKIRFRSMATSIFILLALLCFIGKPSGLLADTGGKHSTQTTVKSKKTHAKSGSKSTKKSLSKKKKAGKAHGSNIAGKASGKGKSSTAKASTKRASHGEKTGTFTVYTAKEGAGHGKTADGTSIKNTSGCIVANNHLPLGTKIKVEGIGTCEVRDRIPGKKGGDRFDIHVKENPKQARKFGKQRLKYTVISEAPKGQSG